MADRSQTRILLGHITAAHGIRGEVVVKAYTDNPLDIAAYGALSDGDGLRTFALSHLRVTKKGVIARIAGVSDRNAAEALCGTKLYVERSKLPEPGADEIYHADIVGLMARRQDGSEVGEIVAIQNFGASDLLEIRLKGKRSTEFVPFTQDFVPELNLAAGRVVVIMPDDTACDTAAAHDREARNAEFE